MYAIRSYYGSTCAVGERIGTCKLGTVSARKHRCSSRILEKEMLAPVWRNQRCGKVTHPRVVDIDLDIYSDKSARQVGNLERNVSVLNRRILTTWRAVRNLACIGSRDRKTYQI